MTLLLLGFLGFGALAVKFYVAPIATAEDPGEILRQELEYDYRVYPSPSILFPAGSGPRPPGEDTFFAALTERIQFEVAAEVTAVEPLETDRSDLVVELFLRSGDRWSKKMSLAPAVTVSQTESGTLLYRAVFDLPLREARALGEAILEETGTRLQGDGLGLVIRSTLSTALPGGDSADPGERSLSGEYEFILEETLLRAGGERQYSDSVLEAGAAARPASVDLLGYPVNVLMGRILTTVLFLTLGLAAICGHAVLRRERLRLTGKRERMIEKNRKLFGSRLVRAARIRDTANSCKVEVAGARELARIADEVEKPIIEIIPDNVEGKLQTVYYVVDGETLYHFKL